jgi:polyisoprenoid-binding protein YceI
MFSRVCVKLAGVALVVSHGLASPAIAEEYAVDPAHAGVNFKISHLGLSWVQGRFDEFSGDFTIDASAPDKCSFALKINPGSVDTNNQKRDEHLRGPDFFNANQFPAMSFKSTSVRPLKNGYEVTGDFTLHGVTKPVSFELVGGRTAEFPKGVQRTGFSADFSLKRSDFGITKFTPGVGDKIYVSVSFEGTRK